MTEASRVDFLGWGNQPRVALHPSGAFSDQETHCPAWPAEEAGDLAAAGDGLYKMASIVNDQFNNPFLEAGVSLDSLEAALTWIESVVAFSRERNEAGAGFSDIQAKQARASAGVVVLSIAESLASIKGKGAQKLRERAMVWYFAQLEAESDPLLRERLVLNLDWIIPSLPSGLANKARDVMTRYLPLTPPYQEWFAEGNVLRIDWKCGEEFLEGWRRRLREVGFAMTKDGGNWGESVFERDYRASDIATKVVMTLGLEQRNVFRHMNDATYHIVGYDGHSDWGRTLPRSLEYSPAQKGAKVILYLLCCGKQILQKVRDQYPDAQIVTTFNSSKFSADFRYSEDFSAFLHILDGIAGRESWEEIRSRVNGDWYHNPEKNYIFPIEPLVMARSLDRDHDGQADIFDRLIDYNTFNVVEDTRGEFSPRVPETPPQKIVGTRLHLSVQVFHTLAHFNELLEGFTHDLRVFAAGWYDPIAPSEATTIERGPTRVRIIEVAGRLQYFFQGSAHYAHASEESWRALAALSLCMAVMAHEVSLQSYSPLKRALNGLLLVAHSLEVDDARDRDEVIWEGLSKCLALPEMPLEVFKEAKKVQHRWYAGSRASLSKLENELSPDILTALTEWAGTDE